MLIKDESEITEKIEDIYSSQKALFLYYHESGNLVIQNRWESSFYLAYLDGHWYSSCNKKKGGSDNRRVGNFLILALDNIWYIAPRKRNLAEFSTPKSPLSKDHHTFILFCHKMKLYLIAADGTKTETFIYEEFHATPKLWKILFMSVCAMIRQYDSASADDIEDFWKDDIADPVLDPKKEIKPCIFTANDSKTQEAV